jgi:hypothetical protein
MPHSLGHSAWEERFLEAEAEALRYRMASSRLRLRRRQINGLRQRVQLALEEEQAALQALEAEAVRQQQQQQQALKYGQYLSVLSTHIDAASGGCIGMIKLQADSDEINQVLTEVGAPPAAPLQVLHAYRLRNNTLNEEFNRKAGGDATTTGTSSAGSGMSAPSPPGRAARGGSRGGSGGGTSCGSVSSSSGGSASDGRAGAPPPGYTHRLLAMRLPASAVEHVLVHGLRPKPKEESGLDWQVDPRTVPEAGCVDLKSLGKLIGASLPPPPPFALFGGAAAWGELLAGAIEEAITARDAAAVRLTTRRRQAGTGVAGAVPASAAATDAAGGRQRVDGEGNGSGIGAVAPTSNLLLLARVLVPLMKGEWSESIRREHQGKPPHRPHTPPGTATADPEEILPLYLVHYGTMTSAPPEPLAAQPLAVSSRSEKSMAQTEARTSEPRGHAGARGDGRSSGKSGTSGKSSRAAAAAAREEAEREPSASLPMALRATHEHAVYLASRKTTADCMREVAAAFAMTIEGMDAQLTPARAASLVEDSRREAELHVLLADARAELSKLKKGNRDLAAELQTTY